MSEIHQSSTKRIVNLLRKNGIIIEIRETKGKSRHCMHFNNKDGCLYPEEMAKDFHEITEEDICRLLLLAEEEDAWSEQIRRDVKQQLTGSNSPRSSILLDLMRPQYTGSTVVNYPFGKSIITFNGRRHFFRGESMAYPYSLPSLNRKLKGMDARKQELYRAVANLRVAQFSEFIWKINIVPYWEAKLCDINYKALAQHYGFDTHLLDLTNDFRVALFFATCVYNSDTDEYMPLTNDIIEAKDENKHGVIFHTPNWLIDYRGSYSLAKWNAKYTMKFNDFPFSFDSGDLDGLAFQVGYQPLMRCHNQYSYIFPLKNDNPLQNNQHFEKLHFIQSPELSQKVFDMMDGGKKVFPHEGISEAKDILDKMKRATVFSEEDIKEVYNVDGI